MLFLLDWWHPQITIKSENSPSTLTDYAGASGHLGKTAKKVLVSGAVNSQKILL